MKADKSLISGAAQLAQTNLIAQQQKAQAIEGFGQTFSSVYNMIQQQKNAEKLAEKELYEDQRDRYKEEMKDVNDVDYSFEALNAEQVNMYREFATSKKQRYSEIFYELENKSLTQQQRNDLEFEKSVILSDLRNSAASLSRATEKLNETRDSYDADEISNSNFYTNPGSMSTLYDTMMRNNFSIDERGNAIVNLNYNLKATEQANEFVKRNEDIRKQVRTYGINPLESDENKSLRRNKISNSLDDNEVLSFMFDDLEINNTSVDPDSKGYYDSVLAKNPQFKDEFNKMRTHLSDPNKRKEAIKYFRKIVSDELMLGFESNIQAGIAEYKVKNPEIIKDETNNNNETNEQKRTVSQQRLEDQKAVIKGIFNETLKPLEEEYQKEINFQLVKKKSKAEDYRIKTMANNRHYKDPAFVKDFLDNLDISRFQSDKQKLIKDEDNGEYYIITRKQSGEWPTEGDDKMSLQTSAASTKIDPKDGLAVIFKTLLDYFAKDMLIEGENPFR